MDPWWCHNGFIYGTYGVIHCLQLVGPCPAARRISTERVQEICQIEIIFYHNGESEFLIMKKLLNFFSKLFFFFFFFNNK